MLYLRRSLSFVGIPLLSFIFGGGRERTWIQSARAGNRGDFDELLRLHRPAMMAFALRQVSASEAEDLLQEAAITAWEAIPRYEGRSTFRTWLIGILQFKIRHHHRRAARNANRVQLTDESVGVYEEQTSIDTSLVDRAVSTLPAPRAQIIQLYYADGLTLKEIAERMKMKESNVKYHFYQAHSALAILLEASGDVLPFASETDQSKGKTSVAGSLPADWGGSA